MDKKICNGCKKKDYVNIGIKTLKICKNCLLVSRDVDFKFIKRSKKIFIKNKGYTFKPPKDYSDRSKRTFYFFKKLLKFTNFTKKDEILDFGSGYGALIDILNKKFKVTGIEPSFKNYKISKKLGHNVINSFLTKNLFKSKRFKAIISLYVFTYINNLSEI